MGLTKAQLEALNVTSFPDNTTGLITPAILRGYNTASIENTVNQDVYTTDSASFDSRINATSSFATTGSNSFIGNQTIAGGLLVSGSAPIGFSGSAFRVDTTGGMIFKPGTDITFQGNTTFTNPIRTSLINVDNLAGGGFYGFNNEIDGRIYQDFSSSVNSRINAITGSGGTIATGSFATTGSNTFRGNQTISGSVDVSGSAKQTFNAPTLNNQTDIVVVKGATVNSVPFNQQTIGVQNYDFGIDAYKNAFVIEAWDSLNYNFGGEALVNGETAQLFVVASGSGAQGTRLGNIAVIDNGNQKVKAVLTGQIIEIGGAGTNTTPAIAESITIGKSTLPVISIASLNNEITGSTIISGSNGLRVIGNQTITGSVIISGSSLIDLDVIGVIRATGSVAGQRSVLAPDAVFNFNGSSTASLDANLIQNNNGVNSQYLGNTFGGSMGVYNISGLTEIGLALDGATWTTNWANGPIIYVNNTPGDTYEGVFGFQNKANYTDGRITALKRLDVSGSLSVSGSSTFRGNQTITGSLILSSSADVELEVIGNAVITGSLTISSSAANDLTIFGRQLITGPITGQTPQLLISGSDFTNRIDRGFIAIVGSGSFVPTLTISGSSHRNIVAQRAIEIAKPGFDYPVFNYAYSAASSSVLFNFTENLSQTASYTLGVFDNGFTQDVELSLETDVTNGIQFKDIRSDTGAYTTFLKIAPNGGTNPPLEFKRGMQVTGSLSIQSGSGMPSQIGTSLVTWNSATGQIGQATTATLISSSFSAGEFFSTNTLSGSAGVSASIALNNTAISNGVTIQNNSQIAVQNTGTYNIQFSAQCDAFDGADTIWIWFKKNGTNIADSASKLIMQNNTANIMTVNIFDNAVPNDYYEVVWQNNAGAGKIISDAATGNIPRIPSVIVTVNQVK